MSKAWRISSAMAVHMGERFKVPAVQQELTRLVRSDPKAAIAVPEALHFLLADKFHPESRKALQVSQQVIGKSFNGLLTQSVVTCLGGLSTRDCARLLSPSIWKSPFDPPIRHASTRATPGRSHFLLCPSVCTSSTIRWTRLRRAVHLRNVKDLAIVLPSNHLEHESQHVQGR